MATTLKRIIARNVSSLATTGIRDTIGTVGASKVWILHEVLLTFFGNSVWAASARFMPYILPSGGTDAVAGVNALHLDIYTPAATIVPLTEMIQNTSDADAYIGPNSEFTSRGLATAQAVGLGGAGTLLGTHNFTLRARSTVMTAGDALKVKRVQNSGTYDAGYVIWVSYEEVDA